MNEQLDHENTGVTEKGIEKTQIKHTWSLENAV